MLLNAASGKLRAFAESGAFGTGRPATVVLFQYGHWDLRDVDVSTFLDDFRDYIEALRCAAMRECGEREGKTN